MKVLLVSYLFHPHTAGGAERSVLDLARSLSLKGCRVLVMTAGSMEERFDLQPGISVWRIFHRSPYFNIPQAEKKNIFLKAAWRLLAVWNPLVFFRTVSVLRRFRPDIVHVHNFHGFSPSVFSAARLLAIPAVFTPHDYFSICRSYSLFKNGRSCGRLCPGCRLWACWTRLCLGRFHLLSLSELGSRLFFRYLRPGTALLLHHPSPLAKVEIQEAAARKQRLAQKKKTVFLFMGKLSEFKGISWLLETFCREIPPQAILLIAGNGPLRSAVEEFCRQHPANSKFLGEVNGERKRKLLLAADVMFCLSAGGDMAPLVVPEAFCHGIPVVASTGGPVAEWVTPGETGWLIAHGGCETLAAVTAEICANRDTLKDLSRNCFQKALANDRDLHGDEVVAFYSEILAEGRRPTPRVP